jgi:hypothetical protein
MKRACLAAACALVSVWCAASARASTPSTIDMNEHIYGATNVNAVAGHGGLTAGISSEGDLTVLSWPSPSFADQLLYLSSNDLDARDEPHFGALDGMGAYLGLQVTMALGSQVVWLRDPSFTHVQRYTQPYAPVVETTFTRTDLGLTVVVTDIVSPTVDLLTRRVVVTLGAGSPVTGANLVLYENLSPTISRIPTLPLADWLFGWANDFVAVYDRAAGAIIHIHPSDRGVIGSLVAIDEDPTTIDYGPVDTLMRGTPSDALVDSFIASIDSAFPPAVAAIVTTNPPPTAFQVGSDTTSFCTQANKLADNVVALPMEFNDPGLSSVTSLAGVARCTDSLAPVRAARGWTWMPTDALTDATSGTLEGSRLAACQTNGALVAPLMFDGGVAEGEALFAFGNSVGDARLTLAAGTAVTAAARQTASEQAAQKALAGVPLPDPSLGTQTLLVAERALVNLYVARDRTTGATVASIDHQPPYYLDWPRDGSFFMHAIDVAGLLPWGTERGEWYATLQRQTAVPASFTSGPAPTDPDSGAVDFPAFAWEMNYYGDGTVGGNIRFEIDNTALHLWALVVHAAALAPADRGAFVTSVWPSFKSALDLLIRWQNPATGLPALANEDDQITLSSTLHGATAVYAALVAGARLAQVVGDTTTAQVALARSGELRQAILEYYFDPATGLFVNSVGDSGSNDSGADNAGSTTLGDTAWLVWPARVLDPDDPRLEAQLVHDMTSVLADVRGLTGGGTYDMKNVVAAALLGKDGGSRDMAREAVQRLAGIATPDTLHFGEVYVTIPSLDGGPATFSERTATPHTWEGILFYLSAMALTSPSLFDPEIGAFPLPTPTAQGPSAAGSCAAPPSTAQAWPAWGAIASTCSVLAALALVRARRRRASATSPRHAA